MKKKFRLFLIPAVSLSLLMGCGGGSDSDGQAKDSAVDTISYSIEKSVLADTDLYTITILSMEADADDTCSAEIEFTNKTDLDLALDFRDVYVNSIRAGYCDWDEEKDSEDLCYPEEGSTYAQMTEAAGADPMVLGLGAAAGQSGTGRFVFELPAHCNTADEICLTPELEVQHEDDDMKFAESYGTLRQLPESVFYPTGLTSDTIKYPEYEPQDGEQILADEEDFVFVIQSIEPNDDNTMYSINYYCENNSDAQLMFSYTNTKINSAASDFSIYEDLPAGRKASDSSLLMAGYTEGFDEGDTIKDLELTLSIQKIQPDENATEIDQITNIVYENVFEKSFTISLE